MLNEIFWFGIRLCVCSTEKSLIYYLFFIEKLLLFKRFPIELFPDWHKIVSEINKRKL